MSLLKFLLYRSRVLTTCACLLTFLLFGQIAWCQESILVTGTDGTLTITDFAGNIVQTGLAAPMATAGMIIVGANQRLAFINSASYLSVFDISIGREVKRITGIQPGYSAFTADGRYLLVEDYGSLSLCWVDLKSLRITRRVSLTRALGNSAKYFMGSILVQGDKALITAEDSYPYHLPVAVLDLRTLRFRTINLPYGSQISQGAIGTAPNAALTPDGAYLVVLETLYSDSSTHAMLINTSNYQVTDVLLDLNPFGLVIGGSGANTYGYVLGTDVSLPYTCVRVINFATKAEVPGASVPLAVDPINIAVNGDGSKVVVTGREADPSVPQPNVVVLDAAKIVSDPSNAVLLQQTVAGGGQTRGLAVASVITSPIPEAPTVTAVSRNVTNDTATTVNIFGTNFQPGATVRIGAMSALPTNVISSTDLQVTVPVNAPAASGLDMVVTNPNPTAPLIDQYQSGLLPQGITIYPGPAYQPAYQVATLSGADGAVEVFDQTQRSLVKLAASPPALKGIAFSLDGTSLFAASNGPVYNPNGQEILQWNLSDKTALSPFTLTSPFVISFAREGALAAAPNPQNGHSTIHVPSIQSALATNEIDTITGQVTFALPWPRFGCGILHSVAAKPDGSYVYATCSTALAVLNVSTQVGLSISYSLLGVSTHQTDAYVSPDGNSLLLYASPLVSYYRPNDLNAGRQIKVFDISGANATSPQLVATIAGVPAPQSGLTTPFYFSNFVVANGVLYALDPVQGAVVAFNFDRAGMHFEQLNAHRLGTLKVGQSLAISPDGALLYVPITESDAIAVLDAEALALSHPPLVTYLASGLAPSHVAVNPATFSLPDRTLHFSTGSRRGGYSTVRPESRAFSNVRPE